MLAGVIAKFARVLQKPDARRTDGDAPIHGELPPKNEPAKTSPTPERAQAPKEFGAPIALIMWATTGGLTVFLTTVSLPHPVQFMFASVTLVAMALMLSVAKRWRRRDAILDHLRTIVLVLGLVLTLRYISWRILYTVNFHDLASYVGALSLLTAEIYGIVMYFLGAVVNAKPLHRPLKPLDESDIPTVDILIPTYNEDDAILEVTVLAATQMDYPEDSFRVYLLDDGGTLAKRQQQDLGATAEAWNRQIRLRALCQRTGAIYMTRDDNRDAKAGNINAALPRISGDLVLLLDADHVPSADFLANTVGEFQVDPDLFLVQTPHRFVTPDPVEKNLEVHRKMPGESEIFYRIVQHGLDAWHSSFFCGSAAILRRRHLDEIGGLSGETVTEDAETALRLHAKGYKSAYVGKPMVLGLQPETFTGFIGQRCRWAQGMVQLFLRQNPLLKPGLRPSQRLGYLNTTLFWFFSYARLIFLLAPCAFLLLGLKIYDANLQQFLFYAIPHLVGTLITANLLFGRARWTLVSELYEMVQSVFSSLAVTRTLLNPRSPVFTVTDKGERLEEDFVSPMVGPFYLIFLVLIARIVVGYFRFQFAPGQREVVLITAGWAMLNLVILMAGLGALFERRQLRKAPRVYLAKPLDGVIQINGVFIDCLLLDISMGGARIRVHDDDVARLPIEGRGVLEVPIPGAGGNAMLPVRMVRDHGKDGISLALERRSTTVKRWVIALAYGNSDNMAWGVERDRTTPGILGGMALFISLAVRQATHHFVFLVRAAGRLLLAGLDQLAPTARSMPDRIRREGDELEIIDKIDTGSHGAVGGFGRESASQRSTA
jgi:cellulose synthase (UDP-forming)